MFLIGFFTISTNVFAQPCGEIDQGALLSVENTASQNARQHIKILSLDGFHTVYIHIGSDQRITRCDGYVTMQWPNGGQFSTHVTLEQKMTAYGWAYSIIPYLE